MNENYPEVFKMTKEQIIEAIKGMSILEVKDLVEEIGRASCRERV